jgi:hypothetical protein
MKSQALSRLLWSQLGCISREQLVQCAVSRTTVWRRVVTGEWTRMFPGVFRVTSAPEGQEQTLLASTLHGGVGAAVSHRSALKLWGEALSSDEVEVSTLHDRSSHGSCRVHRVKCLPSEQVTRRAGVPVTTPARTLMDVAPLFSGDELDALLGRFLDGGLVRYAELAALAEEERLSGMRGRALLRAALRRRRSVPPGSHSELVDRVAEQLQVPVEQLSEQSQPGVVRLCFPEERVVVEVVDEHLVSPLHLPSKSEGCDRLSFTWRTFNTHRKVCRMAMHQALKRFGWAGQLTQAVREYAGWWAERHVLHLRRWEQGLTAFEAHPEGGDAFGRGHQARKRVNDMLWGMSEPRRPRARRRVETRLDCEERDRLGLLPWEELPGRRAALAS